MYSKLMGAAAIAGLARSVLAATSVAHTDSNTGITFQTYFDSTLGNGYSFGIAVSETALSGATDFIGQLVVPLASGAGWGGVVMGPEMTEKLQVVAWANGDNMVTSLREASAYATPDVFSNSSVTTLPIANGTFINSTHLSYTFLCQGCAGTDENLLSLTANTPIGYAVSDTSPTTPSDASSALTYHSLGSNIFTANITAAQSADYSTWASYASAASTTTPSNSTSSGSASSNSTSSSNSTLSAPTTLNTTYDVIVVGGGASGIIAASRLAESGASVLLLERGPANTIALGNTYPLSWNSSLTAYDVPALGSSLTSVSGTAYCSDTASTSGCLLGGSSSVNGLNFIHPPQHDFEGFPEGWNWADVEASSKKLYELNPGTTQPSEDGKYHNDLAYQLFSPYLKSAGWSEVDSIESPDSKQTSFSRPAWSIANHLRAGPARTYLPAAQALDNFKLQLNTKVVQVLRNGSTVTGVLTQAADGTSTQIINLKSNGKVVLAGGALSTPRILWNSGIGRSDALQTVQSGSTGVTLPSSSDWIDLPVGHNLMDHAQAMLDFTTSPGSTAYDFADLATTAANTSDISQFKQGSGIVTQAPQRMHLWTSFNGSDGVTRYVQGTGREMKDAVVSMSVFLTHGTTSRGELGISSSGNTVLKTKPWLIDDGDREAYEKFIQMWLDLIPANSTNSTASLKYSGNQGATPAAIIEGNLVSGDHWMGTAKMGTDDGRKNGTSVVDTDTRVYGTDNLFVVDASIHPTLPTGNTQAIIMIIAEQAAAKIAAFKVSASSTSNSTVPAVSSSGIASASAAASTPKTVFVTVTRSAAPCSTA